MDAGVRLGKVGQTTSKQIVHQRTLERAIVDSETFQDLPEQQGFQAETAFYAGLLKSCVNSKDLKQGRHVHARILASNHLRDTYLGNLLIDMYGKCGSLDEARVMFDSLHHPNIFSWNIMIAGYAQNGHLQEARDMFDKLPQRNVISWNTMISAYTQNGHLQTARTLFDKMPKRNEVSWNAMIAAYAEIGDIEEAKRLFECMPNKNVISWTAMLAAYAATGHLQEARSLFLKMPKRNVVSWTTMILAYVQNGHLEEARSMFDKMPEKNVVTWTTMIGAYGRNSQGKEALKLFRLMDLEGAQPNEVTLVAITEACGSSPVAAEAKIIHSMVEGTHYLFNMVVVTALINLHGKCGCLEEARSLFDRMIRRDLVLWTAMISAYAYNGLRDQALELFRAMDLEGLQPNEITYINVLSGSAYAGLVEDAWSSFVSMVGDYSIAPMLDHYICMIDVLGRAGKLSQAEELVNSMPFEPDYVSWMTLLSSCGIHVDVDRGLRAAQQASEINPGTSSPYVVLSNIFATTGDLHEIISAGRVRPYRKQAI